MLWPHRILTQLHRSTLLHTVHFVYSKFRSLPNAEWFHTGYERNWFVVNSEFEIVTDMLYKRLETVLAELQSSIITKDAADPWTQEIGHIENRRPTDHWRQSPSRLPGRKTKGIEYTNKPLCVDEEPPTYSSRSTTAIRETILHHRRRFDENDWQD